MERSPRHEEIVELLAPAAVHALDHDEQQAVALHVADCADCRRELDEFEETAGLLGSAGSLPPEGPWEQIESQIGVTPPPMQLARRRVWQPVVGAVAASLVTALAIAGAWVGLREDLNIEGTETELAQLARGQDGSKTLALTTTAGAPIAEVVVLSDGDSYLVNKSLPSLPSDRTYQLWTISTDKTVSAAVLGSTPSIATFTTSPGVEAVAITEETAGGVTASSQTPIAVGQLPAST